MGIFISNSGSAPFLISAHNPADVMVEVFHPQTLLHSYICVNVQF